MKLFEWLEDWRNKIIEGVTKPIQDAVNNIQTWFAEKIIEGLWGLMEKLEPDAINMISDALDELLETGALPASYEKLLKEIRGKKHAVGLLGALSFMGGTAAGFAMQPLSVMLKPATHKLNQAITPEIIPVDALMTLHYRKEIDDDFFYNEMAKWGFDKEQADRLAKAYLYYPSPTDFIRFAVRDVFKSDIVKRYAYDTGWEETEKEIKEYAEKTGISMDVLKWYWRAHWELPSPSMAFEMLHRGLIEQKDIETLLRIADYAPFWIDKIIGISYTPITRVDLRRLYQAGVIDEERLYRGYKELGYNDEDARAITEWVIKDIDDKDRDLTKTEILRNYRIGKVTKERVKEMLKDIGYSEDEADWILTYEDYKLFIEELEEEAMNIVKECENGSITVEEADKRLTELGLPVKVRERYLNKAKRAIKESIKRPGTDDLKRWLKMGIISEEEFKREMSQNKWIDKDIERFIKEVKGEK
ncbi:MAG: hypothetical protein QIT46_gp09 [Methanophagales virus PBV305]|uniref:Uncharacterized protein n=1 Tax=Methanophagales virus PBV305 TaxID=3071310 RepID=A0AA46TDK7_9VIRU|nr:MAG: hypothetical protein QIT46_gp09 [Methanophagales virus PBV305]UYL65061.1 MAG: hypothetical protein HJKPNNFO_00009 [Methanophagales virus PBV305]